MTSPAPPVWLLDVDGVVNAASPRPPACWPESAWLRTKARAGRRNWPILAARPVLDFIVGVHDSGAAEIRWHTSWQDDAAANLAPVLGLPAFAVADAPELAAHLDRVHILGAPPAGGWWKLPAACRVAKYERRALIWTDDEIGLAVGNLGDPAARSLVERPDVLAISPETQTGLTREHLDRIRAFLDQDEPGSMRR